MVGNQYGVQTMRGKIAKDMLRYAFTSQCLFDPELTLPHSDACFSNIAPRKRFGCVLDHYRGKLCTPSDLNNKSVPFMINELVNYCMPLSKITDLVRTGNQKKYLRRCTKKRKPKDCMVKRDFGIEEDYSEERKNEMDDDK